MPFTLASIRHTTALKHVIVARLIAGLPLVGIAAMHLIGAAPLRPILEAAKIPLPDLNTVVAPVVEVVAGLLILSGAFARVGAVLGSVTMALAMYAHVVADWTDEPPIMLPIAVLLAALYVLWRGGGAWSVDAKSAP
jgi:uncharacterized membrane protein YphA (DoxX/SURF4 family)